MPRLPFSSRSRKSRPAEPISAAEIQADFARLENDKFSRKYEREITSWVIREARPETYQALQSTLEKIAAGSDADGTPLDLRFDAFFALANLYRRYSDTDALEQLIAKHRTDFGAYDLLVRHLEIMCLNMRRDRPSCRQALTLAAELWKDGKEEHAGLCHSYAETIALCVEEGYHDEGQDGPVSALLETGLKAVQEAIRRDADYAKFYRTRGWLYFLLGKADEGRHSYREAVRRERPESRDYAVRLGEYRRELDVRNAREELRELRQAVTTEGEELNELKQKLSTEQARAQEILTTIKSLQTRADDLQVRQQESQTRQVEFLGFFTGLLALILGAGGILAQAPPGSEESFGLMLTLGGLLLFVFGAFGFVLHGWSKLARSGIPVLLGALLLASGYWVIRNSPAKAAATPGIKAQPAAPAPASSPPATP
jgi:tetratricopeptide (TPR) repeat protein